MCEALRKILAAEQAKTKPEKPIVNVAQPSDYDRTWEKREIDRYDITAILLPAAADARRKVQSNT